MDRRGDVLAGAAALEGHAEAEVQGDGDLGGGERV